jgi:hypothetical protein
MDGPKILRHVTAIRVEIRIMLPWREPSSPLQPGASIRHRGCNAIPRAQPNGPG